MSRESSAHKRRLEEIAEDPANILGFSGAVSEVVIERELYNSKGQSVGEIDMWVKTSDGDYYVVEYKATDKRKFRRKAKAQLQRAADYVKKKFHMFPKKAFYVYGDLNVEEVDLRDEE